MEENIKDNKINIDVSPGVEKVNDAGEDEFVFTPREKHLKSTVSNKSSDISSTKQKIEQVNFEDLIPFRIHSSQTYHGQRLEQLMNSIERLGLMNSIIVRPVDDGKYEIICGHNRVEAMKALGRDMIRADVRTGLTDDEVIGLYYDSNLNQQSFSDWSYSQKIDAIKYSEKLIEENSQQGKRTDLEKNEEKSETGTSVYTRQKLDENPKRSTTRDKMARRLGIATATLSKYRSIIKLPDDIIDILARMLDEKRLSFEVTYRLSKLKLDEIKSLLAYMQKNSSDGLGMEKIKLLIEKSKNSETALTKKEIQKIMLSSDSQ